MQSKVNFSLIFSGSPYYKYKAIKPLPCRNQNDYRDTSGVCMFQYECLQSKGKPVGYCVNNYLVGSCCKLPALRPQISSSSVMSHFTQSTINESSTQHSVGNKSTTIAQKEATEHSTSSPNYANTNALPNSRLTTETTITTITTFTENRSDSQNTQKTISNPTTLSTTLSTPLLVSNVVTNESIESSTEEKDLSSPSTKSSISSSQSFSETTTLLPKPDTLSDISTSSESFINTLVPDIKKQSTTEYITVNTQQSVITELEVNSTNVLPSVRE